MSKNRLYFLMLAVVIGFIVYVLYANVVHDPQAAAFLSHKSNLKRPLNIPVWLSVMNVHLAFACLALVSGAVNFADGLWGKQRKLHRINGYAYLLSVLIVVVTSGYMAPYATGGKAVSMAFNVLNILWTAITVAALVAIRKRRVDRHRRWMVRSYAFCFTNMSVHLLTSLFHTGFGVDYERSYTVAVYGSILFLLVIAEIVIRLIWKIPVDKGTSLS